MADPLSIAGSVVGIVALADIVFTRTYRYARHAKNSQKEINGLASAVRSLSGILHGLSLVLSELQNEETDISFRAHHINSCRITLGDIDKRLTEYDAKVSSTSKAGKVLAKLKWPFSIDETNELVAEIERHKTIINVALSADSLNTMLKALSRQDKISEDVQDIKKKLESRWALQTHIALGDERQKVLDFFGKIDPSSNHRASLQLRHSLTGLWLTEGQVFRTWLHTKNSKLWLSGIPGAGKTILAASLIEETVTESNSGKAVAYFYCDYKDPAKQDPIHILGSLAAQLSRQNEFAFKILQDLYHTCHPKNEPSRLAEPVVLLKRLVAIAECFSDASIIVDGVDECGSRTSAVIDLLVSLVSEAQPELRLVILSRDIPEIRGPLQDEFHHLEIAAHSEDIKLYVAAEVETRQRKFGRGQLRIRSPALKQHIITTLVDKAAGMFRWVACQLDYLCQLPTDSEKRKALTKLPPTLNETYERILNSVNECDKSVRRMVQATLRWIVSAKERLRVDSLLEAISLEDSNETLDKESLFEAEDILTYCSSLIRWDSTSTYLELAHFTVEEFLLNIEPNSRYSEFSQQREYVYPYLGKTCLTYLNLVEFRQSYIQGFLEWKEKLDFHPFRYHAVRYWFEYAQYGWNHTAIVELAQSLFGQFSDVCYMSWIRDLFLYFEGESNAHGYQKFQRATKIVLSKEMSQLQVAASLGLTEICEWLIQSDLNVNEMGSFGNPLQCATIGLPLLADSFQNKRAMEKPKEIFSYAGAEYSKPKLDPIICFMRSSRTKTMELLVSKGAIVNRVYEDYFGQMHCSAEMVLATGEAEVCRYVTVLLVASMNYVDEILLAHYISSLRAEEGSKTLQQSFVRELCEALEHAAAKDTVASKLHYIALLYRHMSEYGMSWKGMTTFAYLSDSQQKHAFKEAIKKDQSALVNAFYLDRQSNLRLGHGDLSYLNIAIRHNSVNATKLLLSYGFKVSSEIYKISKSEPWLSELLRKRKSQPVGLSNIAPTVPEPIKRITESNSPRQRLLNLGSSNASPAKESLNAFRRAIKNGQLETCAGLVEVGVDINHSFDGCTGCTPFLMAFFQGHVEISRYLLRQGAYTLGQICDRNPRGTYSCAGHTAIHLACQNAARTTLLKKLLELDNQAGSPSFAQTVTPLHVASACNNKVAVEIIVKHEIQQQGKQVNICDSKISRSKLQRQWTLCQNYGLSAPKHITGTALHISTYRGNLEIMQLLLDHGATIDATNDEEDTALHLAALLKDVSAVDLLLKRGANPILTNSAGWTPAALAVKSGSLQILLLLLNMEISFILSVILDALFCTMQ